uniref:Transposase-associated domain-containing protein n=1 Tax=Chenopodium quinoa TaxID=63459 RepID=A0A803N176_CHEQI
MDRSWMNHNGVKDRKQPKYIAGVNEFLQFAFRGKSGETMLKCPCLDCRLVMSQNRKNMQCHLLVYGIDQSYKPWVSHGESAEKTNNNEDGYREEVSDNDDEIDEMPFDDMAPFVFDATNAWNSINSTPVNENEGTTNIGLNSGTHETPRLLQKLMEDMEADLYPGCKTFKRLEFIMSLLHIKVSNKWSDKSFSMLLNALHRAFNYDNNLPSSSYKAKKYTKALGLDYARIDAYVNHCVLFRKEYTNEVKCPKCLAPTWKQDVSQDDESSYEDEGAKRKIRVPQLVLRHFPLIPRLQRMFMCSKLAMHMRWHKKKHFGDDDDGIMRHPRDSKSWKSLDELYPDFVADAQPDHNWRLNKRFFSKKVERRPPPNSLSGHDALEQLHGYPNVEFGKDDKGKRKRGERYIVHQ